MEDNVCLKRRKTDVTCSPTKQDTTSTIYDLRRSSIRQKIASILTAQAAKRKKMFSQSMRTFERKAFSVNLNFWNIKFENTKVSIEYDNWPNHLPPDCVAAVLDQADPETSTFAIDKIESEYVRRFLDEYFKRRGIMHMELVSFIENIEDLEALTKRLWQNIVLYSVRLDVPIKDLFETDTKPKHELMAFFHMFVVLYIAYNENMEDLSNCVLCCMAQHICSFETEKLSQAKWFALIDLGKRAQALVFSSALHRHMDDFPGVEYMNYAFMAHICEVRYKDIFDEKSSRKEQDAAYIAILHAHMRGEAPDPLDDD